MNDTFERDGAYGASDKKQRILRIQKKIWIEYPNARTTLDAILTMLEIPSDITAPCMLVCGAGGSGKTTIVAQLKKMNARLGSPLVFMTLTENPGNLKFKELLMETLGLPIKLAAGKGILSKEIANYIHSHGIKAIVIDEFHESLIVPKNEQLRNLSLLKGLSGDPYNLSVIGFGVWAAKNALSYDDQLSRRFYMYELSPWNLDEDFRNFVASFESYIDLKHPSLLYQEEMLRFLHDCTKGTMDNIVKIIRSSACFAIQTGEERITKELILKVLKDPVGYGKGTHE